MHEYNIGDKIRIVAAEDTDLYKNGDVLTISDASYGHESAYVMVTCAGGKQELAYMREIEPYAPDVITINRADLPEVVADGHGARVGASTVYDGPWARKHAMSMLALAEFLEARERAAEVAATAEKEASEKLNKRRDELAVTYFEGAYSHLPLISYRRAIDRIIELEDSRA